MNRDEMIYVDFVKTIANVSQIDEESVDDDYRRFFMFIVEYIKNGDDYNNRWLNCEMIKMQICFPSQTFVICEYASYIKTL